MNELLEELLRRNGENIKKEVRRQTIDSSVYIYINNLDIYKQKINDFKNNKNNNKVKCSFCEEKKIRTK